VNRLRFPLPVTIASLVLLWTLGLITHSVTHGPPPGLRPHVGVGLGPVTEGRWWVLLTASWFASGLLPYLVATGLMLSVLPIAERTVGSRRTLGLLLGISAAGMGAGLAAAVSMRVVGGRWAYHLRHAIVVEPSAALLGVALAVSAALPVLWRRRIRVVLLVTLSTFVLYSGLLADLLRLACGLVGLGLGVLLFGRDAPRAPAPTRPETRVLLALVVAASALGPVLAAVTGNGSGPLSVLRYVVADPIPDPLTVRDICADPSALHLCLELHTRLRLTGFGPAFMAVMPVVLLLVVAEGLRRGRRAAWLTAVLLHLGLAGLGLVLVRFFPAYVDGWRPVVAVVAAVTMTAGNLAALLQRHAVRLLAWSSVAQAGYLLVPLAAGGRPSDLGALQTYAVMYAIVNLGAFGAVVAAARPGAGSIQDLAGLFRTRPLVGATLVFTLLCLAGLPPGVIGLVAKVVVFQSAVDGALGWLAVVLAVNIAIGLVYYLRFIATVLRTPPGPVPAPAGAEPPSGTAVQAVLALTLAASVMLSVLPGPLLSAIYP
jgi:hypothetical protein